MNVNEEVSKLVHQNGLLPVLRALVKLCDEDALKIPNNLGAMMFAAKLEQIVKMGENILVKHQEAESHKE